MGHITKPNIIYLNVCIACFRKKGMCLLHLCGGHQLAFLTPKVIYTKLAHIRQVSIYLLWYMHKQKRLWDHSRVPNYKSATTFLCDYWLQPIWKKILLLDFNVFMCFQTSLRLERHYRILQISNLFT